MLGANRRPRSRVRAAARGIFGGLALAFLGSCAAPTETPPNILLVYVDDLGWRDLGVQGSQFYETPNIDRLASEGMRFTNAYANAPNCAPSRAALLSGTYAPRTGIYTVGSAARGDAALRRLIPVENRTTLGLDVVTLAEALKAAGYTTGHAGKWHLGGAGFLPADQGFDWAVAGDETGTPRAYFYPYENSAGVGIPGLEQGTEGEYLPDRLTEEAIGFMSAHRDGPFFLYLSHYSVHTPIRAKPDVVAHYDEKTPAGGHSNPTYAAMVHSVDESVGRLLDALDELEVADNTVVIFYADNGGFGPVTSMDPLRGSKGMLYEGGIREPLIVRWPDRVEAGATTDAPVIGTDFYPTLLHMARAEVPQNKQLDGVSLLPLLRGQAGEATFAERPLFWHFPAYLQRDASVAGPWRTTPASSVRRGRYKLLHFFEDDRWELYDLLADIGESTDLMATEPDVAAELQALLRKWWEDTGAFIPSEVNPDFDPMAGGLAPRPQPQN